MLPLEISNIECMHRQNVNQSIVDGHALYSRMNDLKLLNYQELDADLKKYIISPIDTDGTSRCCGRQTREKWASHIVTP